MDRERLTKVLALTTSPNDAEALAAIRKANALITAEGLVWSDVLGKPPEDQNYRDGNVDEDWVAPHLKDKVVIDLMFRTVFSQPRSSNEEFWQFMDGIHHRWQSHGNLSQGQYTALKRCYQRARTYRSY